MEQQRRGRGREIEYRQSYVISPAPPDDASEFTIDVKAISWERWENGTNKVYGTDVGPWRFRVKER